MDNENEMLADTVALLSDNVNTLTTFVLRDYVIKLRVLCQTQQQVIEEFQQQQRPPEPPEVQPNAEKVPSPAFDGITSPLKGSSEVENTSHGFFTTTSSMCALAAAAALIFIVKRKNK